MSPVRGAAAGGGAVNSGSGGAQTLGLAGREDDPVVGGRNCFIGLVIAADLGEDVDERGAAAGRTRDAYPRGVGGRATLVVCSEMSEGSGSRSTCAASLAFFALAFLASLCLALSEVLVLGEARCCLPCGGRARGLLWPRA